MATIGLLPLYLALYDETSPAMRKELESYYMSIVGEFELRGIMVRTSPPCRLEAEFKAAIAMFETEGADVLVTLHLAYSPSLESLSSLLETTLPIVVLDTTPDYDFGPEQSPKAISYNHGIHGVQDMCSMLVRNGRPFSIEAGHWRESDVIERTIVHIRALVAAQSIKKSRIGIIGTPFTGMGDFFVSTEELQKTIGIETVPFAGSPEAQPGTTEEEDKKYLSTLGTLGPMDDEVFRANVNVMHTIKAWITREELDGFTFNFLDVERSSPIDRVPFLAASVGMAEGYGYAGEGDILTAALVSAMLKIQPETSFTEMFCPDWRGNTIFLSHMGEINPRICDPKVQFLQKEYAYSDSDEPLYVAGQFRSGDAHIVNLVPMGDGAYRLVVATVQVEAYGKTSFGDSVHGWIRPNMEVGKFLAQYSRLGGTHHSALVYGEPLALYETFCTYLGWELQVIA